MYLHLKGQCPHSCCGTPARSFKSSEPFWLRSQRGQPLLPASCSTEHLSYKWVFKVIWIFLLSPEMHSNVFPQVQAILCVWVHEPTCLVCHTGYFPFRFLAKSRVFLQYFGAFLAAFHKPSSIDLACAYFVLPNALYIINHYIVNLKHLLYKSTESLRQSLLYF